jgi:glycosyltransferase involved in cell wall biosynthesis
VKILWHSTAPWSPSGYGQQTALWTKKLTEMGHEVVISAYWGLAGSPITWDGIPVLPGFGANYCSPSLQQHAKMMKPDVIITLGDVWVLDPNLLRDLPIAHWLPADCRPMSYVDKVEVVSAQNKLIAMSKFGYERFTDTGFDALYCPHGIDTGIFKPPEDRAGLREAFGLEEDAFLVGVNAANNDAIRKAAPEMMLAFAKFHQDHPEAMLALHTGIHQDGGQDLEFLGEHLGITDRMLVVDQYRYACGLITPRDMANWTQAIDVLLASTYAEGFGLPIIEAQACGTPVITTDASSMTELNPHGYHVTGDPFWNGVHRGWWMHPSAGAMVTGLEWAYQNRHALNKGKLREFALEYDINVVAEKYMAPALASLGESYGQPPGKPGGDAGRMGQDHPEGEAGS